MKYANAETAALLQSARQVFMVELYTLTLIGGEVFRWAGADVAIPYGANVWTPGPIIERGAVKAEIGLGVPTCDVTLYATSAVQVLGMPLIQAALRGVLDGAELAIVRAFTPEPGAAIVGTVHVFEGRIADAEVLSNAVRVTLKGHTELLDSMFPVGVYQAPCMWSLYSAGCGVSKAAHALAVTAGAGSDRGTIVCGVTGQGVYDLGEIIGVTGANAGLRRTVKRHTAGALQLSHPLPATPAAGDTFTAWKGCDKTRGTCAGRFANEARFKGFPYVPKPETVL